MRNFRSVALVLVLTLAACARGVEPPPLPPAPVELNGSTFRLVSYRGEPAPDGKYLLSFDAKSLQANFCNRLFGAYLLEGDRLSAGLAGTKMYCTAPQVMEMEQVFTDLLAEGATLQRESHRLSLIDARGVAVFGYQVFMD